MLVFTAKLKLIATSAGGRRRPIRSGYIGGIKYGGQVVDGLIRLLDCEILWPGEESVAVLRVPNPQYAGQPWKSGGAFELVEGPRIIGTGEIVSIEPIDV